MGIPGEPDVLRERDLNAASPLDTLSSRIQLPRIKHGPRPLSERHSPRPPSVERDDDASDSDGDNVIMRRRRDDDDGPPSSQQARYSSSSSSPQLDPSHPHDSPPTSARWSNRSAPTDQDPDTGWWTPQPFGYSRWHGPVTQRSLDLWEARSEQEQAWREEDRNRQLEFGAATDSDGDVIVFPGPMEPKPTLRKLGKAVQRMRLWPQRLSDSQSEDAYSNPDLEPPRPPGPGPSFLPSPRSFLSRALARDSEGSRFVEMISQDGSTSQSSAQSQLHAAREHLRMLCEEEGHGVLPLDPQTIYEQYRHHTERHRELLERRQAEADDTESHMPSGGPRFSEQFTKVLAVTRSGDSGSPIPSMYDAQQRPYIPHAAHRFDGPARPHSAPPRQPVQAVYREYARQHAEKPPPEPAPPLPLPDFLEPRPHSRQGLRRVPRTDDLRRRDFS
ncbi:unnamed protein product [Peniophora sp. CBMAI 1063]|nr:unnamed protein product [Peniophora sp. CBMAI 1063]